MVVNDWSVDIIIGALLNRKARFFRGVGSARPRERCHAPHQVRHNLELRQYDSWINYNL